MKNGGESDTDCGGVVHNLAYLRMIPNLVVCSPDTGFAKDASAYARLLGCPVVIGNKQRVDHTERAEVLEQLRAMQHGIPIGITEVDFTSIGVDTPEDLQRLLAYELPLGTLELVAQYDLPARLSPRPVVGAAGQWNL